MDLNKYERAAVVRVNKSSNVIKKKMTTVMNRINKLANEYKGLKEEFDAIESYVVTKYGHTSEEILNNSDSTVEDVAVDTEESVNEESVEVTEEVEEYSWN